MLSAILEQSLVIGCQVDVTALGLRFSVGPNVSVTISGASLRDCCCVRSSSLGVSLAAHRWRVQKPRRDTCEDVRESCGISIVESNEVERHGRWRTKSASATDSGGRNHRLDRSWGRERWRGEDFASEGDLATEFHDGFMLDSWDQGLLAIPDMQTMSELWIDYVDPDAEMMYVHREGDWQAAVPRDRWPWQVPDNRSRQF